MMDKHHQPGTIAHSRVFEHLLVTGRIAESTYRASTDDHVNPFRLTGFVVDQEHFGKFDQFRITLFVVLVFHLAHAADNLLRRYAVDLLGKGPHKLLTAAGHDVDLEPVVPQVLHQLEHWLIHAFGIRPFEARMLRFSEPLLNDLQELLNAHTTVRNGHNLFEILDTEFQHCRTVVRKDRFERLGLTPLRMLRRLRNDFIDGESYLRVNGLFNPKGAVIIEGRNAFLRLNKIR